MSRILLASLSLFCYSFHLAQCLKQDGEQIWNATLASVNDKRKLMETWQLRFNKFSGDPSGFKPLMPDNYPVHGEVYDILYEMTDAVDVMMTTDEELENIDVPKLIEKLGGSPSHPEEDEDAEFWDVSQTS